MFLNTVTEYILCIALGAICLLVLVTVIYYRWKFTFWKRKGVYTPPPSFPFGNMGASLMGQTSFAEMMRLFYNHSKSLGVEHYGVYFCTKPVYVATDLDVLKHILQVDFSHFLNHGDYSDSNLDPLSAHLFTLEGAKWKGMRAKLTPTFTAGKIKAMFQTLVNCSDNLIDTTDRLSKHDLPMDVSEVFARFFTDVIASCAFGIELDTMREEEPLFRHYGKLAVDPAPEEVIRNVKQLLQFVVPHNILRKCRFRLTRKDVENFFMGVIRDEVSYRGKNNVKRFDLLQLLVNLADEDTGGISMNEITALCFGYFAAAFETSASANTFAMYELAKNQDIQDTVRSEIRATLENHGGQISYDSVMDMKYLDKVVYETLRKYPPAPAITRVCNKRFTIPGSSLTLEEGTKVFVSALGIQRDPAYYPNPDKFDPERFEETEKLSRHPFAWIPFGAGPRKCIGMRLGILQTKVGLIAILKNHQISLNKKTREPIKFNTRGFMLKPDSEILINLKKIE